MTSLIKQIKSCTRCEMSSTRKNPVIGDGPVPCNVLFLGEAPGNKEDETGVAFTGPSGDVLEAAAFKAGLGVRGFYHVLNMLKCQPKGRPATLEEFRNCEPYLVQQIKKVDPKVIVAFGKHAQAYVLGIPVSKVHVLNNAGRMVPMLKGRYAILSYHPAYVLRSGQVAIQKAFEKHLRLATRFI